MLVSFWTPVFVAAQDPESQSRESIVATAREMISGVRFGTLITLDESGHPQARTMEPFQPEDNMVVWFGTNRHSGKVEEIEADSRATLHYQMPDGKGYVTMTGHASLVDESAEKEKRWMPQWSAFYPDREEMYVLIKFVPDRLEVVSYPHGLIGDSVTWEAPTLDLQ